MNQPATTTSRRARGRATRPDAGSESESGRLGRTAPRVSEPDVGDASASPRCDASRRATAITSSIDSNRREGQLLADIWCHIIQVFEVAPWQHNRANTSPVSRQHFLFDAADGQHTATQRNSPVIARSLRTGRRVSAEMIANAIVMPADGPSFGIAPSGQMDVNIRSSGSPLADEAPARVSE